ncbi:hypothetical protein C1645_824776 [Glomus cerebriforme]|uniref:Uncharacterized protein n=1 Tax=Glomus cerebriforme TaxID=658196 RepID=A0A397STU0_9GLOM|nr:hypothetical protein C1645_824776 [Glomus cerebriforme]
MRIYLNDRKSTIFLKRKKLSSVKKRRDIPRDPIRWKPLELIAILNYLNNNFDLWSSNRLGACNNAKEATNIARDGKAIYSKVYSMIKAMDDYNKTGKKSTANTIIWDNTKIHELVKDLCKKIKENKGGETSDDESMSMDTDQITTEASTSRTYDVPRQVPLSVETVDSLYNEKLQYISQLRSTLIETIENANSTLERSNIQTNYSTEDVNKRCNDKTQLAKKLRSELMEMIKDAKNKYEQLRDLQ